MEETKNPLKNQIHPDTKAKKKKKEQSVSSLGSSPKTVVKPVAKGTKPQQIIDMYDEATGFGKENETDAMGILSAISKTNGLKRKSANLQAKGVEGLFIWKDKKEYVIKVEPV